MDDKFLGMPRYSFVEVGGPIRSGFLFLLHLAWESRFRLPILLIVGLMVLDVRMQLEIDFDAELMQDRRNRLVEIIDDEWRNDDDEGEDDDSDDDFDAELIQDRRNRFVEIIDDDWRNEHNEGEDIDSDEDELELDGDVNTEDDGDSESVDDDGYTNNTSMTDSYEGPLTKSNAYQKSKGLMSENEIRMYLARDMEAVSCWGYSENRYRETKTISGLGPELLGGGKNVFADLKRMINQSLIGVGCPACVESLMEFCQFVQQQSKAAASKEYQQLLYHSKT